MKMDVENKIARKYAKPGEQGPHRKKKQKKHMTTVDGDGYALPSGQGIPNKKKGKKGKSSGIRQETASRLKINDVNEDVAESIDSGCISDMTDWPQVQEVLIEENNFISNLLSWIPGVKSNPEPEEERPKGNKRKNREEEEDAEEQEAPDTKKFRAGDGDRTRELQELRDKYSSKMNSLKQKRNTKVVDFEKRKKQTKLEKKLSKLQKRKDNRTKKDTKGISIKEEPGIKKEKGFSQSGNRQTPSIYNQKGELVFSKFDFTDNSSSGSIETSLQPKDLQKLLSQALKQKEKVKRLEKKGDVENAAGMLKQKAWSDALQRAEGVKVKSDVELLKKSIKKRQARKKASKKKWDQRKEAVMNKMTEKQKSRQANVKARKEAKLNKKMKKMKNKGHIVPGF